MNQNSKLSTKQAFDAMRLFLEGYYDQTASDDVGSLLGDLQNLPDGLPADSAAWQDWLLAVQTAKKESEKDE